jgi:hypothetical protein
MHAALTLSPRTPCARRISDPEDLQRNGRTFGGAAPCLGLALLIAGGTWAGLFAALSLVLP